ncbi:hypothetical protein CMI48_03490 [Candidatus Pacearchaeota archaeon]|nr:hypothetical protein [Candidatus Pacearchaeota archaeon]
MLSKEVINMPKKFLRRDTGRYSKLGKNRKKLQRWKKPTGRDNKMREKRHGYPAVVSVGYKRARSEVGKINGLVPTVISTLKALQAIDAKTQSVILSARLGAKKKLELMKAAKEKKLTMLNVREAKK